MEFKRWEEIRRQRISDTAHDRIKAQVAQEVEGFVKSDTSRNTDTDAQVLAKALEHCKFSLT